MAVKHIPISCGIGDCLVYCQLNDLYPNRFKFTFNTRQLQTYRSQKHLSFMRFLFKKFNATFEAHDSPHQESMGMSSILKEYPIEKTTLVQHVTRLSTEDLNLPKEYICVSVNSRLFHQDFRPHNAFVQVLNSLPFSIPIVLIGHRRAIKVGPILNNSFYDKLALERFIDRTQDIDLVQHGDADNFERDCNIIHNAKECFQIEGGGGFCMQVLFARKLCVYHTMSELDRVWSSHFFALLPQIEMYADITQFLSRLRSYAA